MKNQYKKQFSKIIPVKKRIHPLTGKICYRRRRLIVFKYKNEIVSAVISGWFPNDNSDAILSCNDVNEIDKLCDKIDGNNSILDN